MPPPTLFSGSAAQPGAIKTTAYQEKVYSLLRQIPAGKVTTYKLLSDALDSSPRAIGGALRKNPYADAPCHRVIATTGHVGGFFGTTTGAVWERKLKMLKDEGVEFNESGVVKEKERIWGEFVV